MVYYSLISAVISTDKIKANLINYFIYGGSSHHIGGG